MGRYVRTSFSSKYYDVEIDFVEAKVYLVSKKHNAIADHSSLKHYLDSGMSLTEYGEWLQG